MSSIAPELVLAGETLRPLKRVEYDRLVELGAFQDERVELLAGVLVAGSPQGARHAQTIQRLTQRLVMALAGRAEVRVQLPLAASAESEPEPDFAVVAPGDYASGHPTRAFLVIEVAETSQQRDRVLKGRLYASAGIPEYWLCDLAAGAIEVHTAPGEDGYQQVEVRRMGDSVGPSAFSDVVWLVSDLLPAVR
ncbi:MAG: Uma2 family endonuclease [Deltaproteobacteria bacterium]|nr:Uma2 family endonuclease [Deltaproteobacteria bacterium]